MTCPSRSPGKAVFLGLTLVVSSLLIAAPDAQSPPSERHAELLAKADADGELPIIVELRADVVPEHTLAGIAEVDAQRAAIALSQDVLLSRVNSFAPRAVQRYMTIPALAFVASPDLIRDLLMNPDVVSISENRPNEAFLTESVPLIGASAMHSVGVTGAGYTVAVLDSGFQTNHPFFGSRIVSEACYSNMGVTGPNSTCPGFVGSSTAPGSSNNCAFDNCSHGTHVAGIAAGTSGVAPGAALTTINVFTWTGSGYSAFDSDIIAGLDRVYALRNTFNIAAVNLSLGGGRYFSAAACDAANPIYVQLFNNLRAAGIAPVVASGNDGFADSMSAPACVSNAVSVGNTTKADSIWTSSNQAPWQTLLAPGTSIVSSLPSSSFGSLTGTSMAAPHVAGAWALLNQRTGGAASVQQGVTAFRSTGLAIQDPASGIFYPRIRVDQGLAQFPLISNITNQTITEDTALNVPFSVNDAQQGADALTFQVFTSNLALTPTFSVTGTGTSRTLTVPPAANQHGSAFITLVASDGQFQAADSFLLTVTPENDPPAISPIADRTINEDGSTGAIPFTVADVETPAGSLAVSGVSSNPALVPNTNIVFGGSGGNRTVSIAPTLNQSGVATITVQTSDGVATESVSFLVTVLAVNDPPTISPIADQSVVSGASIGPLAVNLADVDHPVDVVTLTATSSNQAVVPNGNLVLSGSGGTRSLTIQAAPGATGSAVVSLVASDGVTPAMTTFTVTVTHSAPASLSSVADGSLVDFSWQAPSLGGAVTGYRLELGNLPGVTTATLDTGNSTTLSATTIAPGTWFARVRPLGTGVVGPASNEVSFALTGLPSRPRSLSVAVSGNAVSFNWLPPAAGGVGGYLIEAGSSPGQSNLAVLPLGVTTSFNVTAPNGSYYVRVRAGNGLGLGNPSNEVFLTAGPVSSGPPQNLRVTVTGSTVTLAWDPPVSGGAPTSYLLEAGSAAGLANIAAIPIGGTGITVPGVPNGTYFVRVKGVNAAGVGPASDEVSLTVGGPPPELPGPPSTLVPTVVGSSVSLSWVPPATGGEVSGYIVYAGSAPGLSNLAALAIGPTPAFSTSGVPSGTYYVRVVATNAAGASAPSNEVTVVVP